MYYFDNIVFTFRSTYIMQYVPLQTDNFNILTMLVLESFCTIFVQLY